MSLRQWASMSAAWCVLTLTSLGGCTTLRVAPHASSLEVAAVTADVAEATIDEATTQTAAPEPRTATTKPIAELLPAMPAHNPAEAAPANAIVGRQATLLVAETNSNEDMIEPPPPGIAAEVVSPVLEADLHGTPINLGAALQLTAGQNPQVAFAQQRVDEALAQLQGANVLWVPSLRTGFNYNKHEGRIQDVVGNIIETSRGSVYTGFGAQAVGAGSPAVPGLLMNFHMSDAIFQPRIAERALGARREASRATTNDALLETSLAYVELLETAQIRAIASETVRHSEELVKVTTSFARSGEGLQSDADRALADLAVRKIEVRRAIENHRVASVRLARVLSLDQSQTLVPIEPAIVPIELTPECSDLNSLISIGLSNRPELSSSQFLVEEAIERFRREKHAPFVPSVLLGLSYGGNGGGIGSEIVNFGDRMDFDAVAFWEVRNLGFGEHAARWEACSRVEQARWRQVQVLDQVASDVAEAHVQVVERRAQIELAQEGITAAEASYRRNIRRIEEAEGLPIEALQAIQALDLAQRQYVRAVADFNRAQFRLQRALGWPVSA